jgi:hypothetical protein
MAALTSEQLVGIFEDQRDLKNLMGKICYTILLKQEKTMVETFWSSRDDICLGTNDGYYDGAEAVKGYYAAVHQHTVEATAFLKKAFPDRMGKLTEEEQFGAGSMDVKPMDTAVIEVAGDGETAKGIWYSRGTYNDLTPQGPLAFWSLGIYACDFVRENGQWKVWHMLNLTDIHVPGGRSWGDPNPAPYPDVADFVGAKPFTPPAPNRPQVLREVYRPGRPFAPLPEPPVPYSTFAETFSYGCDKEV